jgi:phosphonatase-like hydrolase
MKVDLVVFDLAGTTVRDDDDAVGNCFRAALAGAELSVDPARVNAVMGLPKPEAIRRLIEASRGAPADADEVETVHLDFVRRMRQHYATDPGVGEVPGAAAVFAALRRGGVKVALNTGFSRDIVDVILERLGWGTAVDATVASDEVAQGRPHPDMIRHLMTQLGVRDAARVAKVGDTVVDLKEGANAGCGLVIGVTTGRATREQLQRGPHTHLVGSVAEVPALLT